ncbi:subtilisin-like protease SBT3.10 isoform X2 [Amborella trichopoda]|uniref:subtilisin-like protease SBT3.10 isoform X2 n=1 Tax=Amborella trichopoda TaxID=13333 RepID=UPI0005D3CDDF|nr:subtilisin-like protease SBT3.10 isoform X2 [Amborella trichopoda]|eukprot:XP_011622336.1 subtilisin-like protease SBT3.10 isoform X2 [Amborella trichopoda]
MAYNTTTLLLSFSLFIVIVIVAPSQGSSVKEAKVQIVFMERYPQVIEVQQHLRALASILGSEEAARKAIIYTYKNTINGFSAMLTDSQVAALSTWSA